MWIAVTPVSLDTDIRIEKNSELSAKVMLRDQFCFPSNNESRVKITKWTGKDAISSLVVKPQVVTLVDENDMTVRVENPFYDRPIKLRKGDKVGCLSILASPVPRAVRCVTPDRSQNMDTVFAFMS